MDFVHTISNSSDNAHAVSDDRDSHTISQIENDEVTVYVHCPGRSTVEQGSSAFPAEIPPYFEPEVNGTEVEEEDAEDREDDEDYEYEEDDDAQFSGFLANNSAVVAMSEFVTTTEEPGKTAPATIRDEDEQQFENTTAVVEVPAEIVRPSNSQKWRQPSKAAVNMSLRAEQEKNGGKRRLAQDLYRIMNQETLEAGFSLQPAEEDCMNRWTIKLFKFDEDSNLAKDMMVLGLENIELEMSFPEQYPFEPPFVRVVKPKFKRQTGFVMNGALCMELLTKDGWSPINDIESVIVSIRSQIPVGDGRLEAAVSLPEAKYNALLKAAQQSKRAAAAALLHADNEEETPQKKRQKTDPNDLDDESSVTSASSTVMDKKQSEQEKRTPKDEAGAYSVSEAKAAFSHLSDYHKKKGWDTSGWWARKG